jgi:hypothetical protein
MGNLRVACRRERLQHALWGLFWTWIAVLDLVSVSARSPAHSRHRNLEVSAATQATDDAMASLCSSSSAKVRST